MGLLPQTIAGPLADASAGAVTGLPIHVHLALWHGVGIGAQAGEYGCHFGRQKIARVHGDELPHFHCRAAHLRELLCNPEGVGRRQQQITELWALAVG